MKNIRTLPGPPESRKRACRLAVEAVCVPFLLATTSFWLVDGDALEAKEMHFINASLSYILIGLHFVRCMPVSQQLKRLLTVVYVPALVLFFSIYSVLSVTVFRNQEMYVEKEGILTLPRATQESERESN